MPHGTKGVVLLLRIINEFESVERLSVNREQNLDFVAKFKNSIFFPTFFVNK